MAKKSESSLYTISRLDQLEVLKSCVRDRICDVVAQAGELTAHEIASRLGVKPNSIYPHLDLLVEVGLLVERDQVRTNKNFARTFATPKPHLRLDRESTDPDVRAAINAILASQLRQAAREFESAVERSTYPREDPSAAQGLGIAWLTAWMDDKSISRVKEILDELDELFMIDEPGPGKSLYALTYVARPVAAKSSDPVDNP